MHTGVGDRRGKASPPFRESGFSGQSRKLCYVMTDKEILQKVSYRIIKKYVMTDKKVFRKVNLVTSQNL